LVAKRDFFGMTLAYDEVGNIKNQNFNYANRISKDKDPIKLKAPDNYMTNAYTYDNNNRLLTHIMGLNQNNSSAYLNLAMNYDNNGNIESLSRRMMGTLVDNLTYTYTNNGNSNKLLKVDDTGGQDNDPRWQTFKQKNGSAPIDYTYDNAGNMISDHNKGLSGINYNFLNLPSSVPDKSVLNYYTASGYKVRSLLPEGNFHYLGPVVYKNGKIDFISTSEGRALRPGTSTARPWL
jgi:hypothetical protein